MSNDPSVLVPISEFTKILRRVSDLERKVAELECRDPNKEEFEKSVLLHSKEAARQAINGVEFHILIKILLITINHTLFTMM